MATAMPMGFAGTIGGCYTAAVKVARRILEEFFAATSFIMRSSPSNDARLNVELALGDFKSSSPMSVSGDTQPSCLRTIPITFVKDGRCSLLRALVSEGPALRSI